MKKTLLLIVINSVLVIISSILFNYIYSINKAQKFNLLLITVDTLRPDYMSIYNQTKNTTPNIDHFFENGFVFTNVYTATPKTYASIVSLFTSYDPSITKIFNFRGRSLKNSIDTVTKVYQREGYETSAFIVNSALIESSKGKSTNLDSGFDLFNFSQYSQNNFSPKFSYFSSKATADRNYYESNVRNLNTWINQNKQKRFFSWIHLIDPHAPYIPPKDQYCKKDQDCRNSYKENMIDLELLREQNRGLPSGCSNLTPNKSLKKKLVEIYEEEIKYTDKLIGQILRNLERQNLVDKTIVVLTADHGEGFDHNYYFQHGTLYNSNVRIPLLIKYPRRNESSYNRLLIQNTDIIPTILSLADRKLNNDSQTYLFSDIISRNPIYKLVSKKRPYIYGYNHYLKYFSINDGQYKYLYSIEPNCLFTNKKEELYNINQDQLEVNNLTDKEIEVKSRLKRLLFDHLKMNRINVDN